MASTIKASEDGGYAGSYAHFSIHHEMLSDSARTEAYRWEWKILYQLTWK